MYKLPQLKYDYKDLEPHISREIMELHHKKHHQAYVDGANAALKVLETARKRSDDVDQKGILKNLSFNLAGRVLHTNFWQVLGPAKGTNDKPEGAMWDGINKTFGSFERFQSEFG